MKRNEICYVAIVVIIGASLLLGFAEEVFHTDLPSIQQDHVEEATAIFRHRTGLWHER